MQAGDNNGIDSRAAQWTAREDRAPLSAAELAERDAWLGADPRHFGAYARAHAVFARTGRARALAPAAGTAAAPVPRRAARRVLGWGMGLAAVLSLAALGLQRLADDTRDYGTGRGEVLRVALEDGSAVTLDSDTLVRVKYGRDRRDVSLLRGEALFDVAKDRQRPFVVRAADTSVTAVGTSFAVSLLQRRHSGVEVLVREGTVDVADTGGGVAPARLMANYRALSDRGRGIRVEPVQQADVHQALAWREGMLAFNGDTLSVAAAQFLRYSDVRIVIDDPRIGGRRIVGLYSATDPAGFARSVAVSLGLVVERQGNVIRLLEPPQAASPTRASDHAAEPAAAPHSLQ
ncbi:FecR domain-containing protein [Stenotrophomonas sp. MMGLT7]|uniref:FecR family protein n=1 Tax=Stenotrophomonas sp. MMGLT7 TaxID=2901227 RepID=UPI001E2C4EAB|nr:FecR domain-containing protein [Stenotrophomonas sp. MMGLT7]MCD7097193.1 FecR domain-containing protein [Stenotrophomonas sp. MMGLT7]